MILKTLTLGLSLFLSFSAHGKVMTATVVKGEISERGNLESRDLRTDLIRAREFILRGDSQSALYVIDQLISQTGGGLPPRDFVRLGIVHNTTNSTFRCSSVDQNRAMEVASRAAVNDCRMAGYNSCRIIRAFIRSNGFIGTINGIYYGYGCVSDATARGF